MIQTQLLKLEAPYQIISYGGEVALHVATLIVTQEKTDSKGRSKVETHCHPVVNYSDKAFFIEKPERLVNHLCNDNGGSTPHPKAAGTIWDKVDVSMVKVIGIAGITKELSWKEVANGLTYIKDSDEFHLQIRRTKACLRDLGIPVIRYKDDIVPLVVDAYKVDDKQMWTDVFLDNTVIYSAATKSWKQAKEAWLEVGRGCQQLLIGRESDIHYIAAPWNKDKALVKAANECTFHMPEFPSSKTDEKV